MSILYGRPSETLVLVSADRELLNAARSEGMDAMDVLSQLVEN